MDDYVNIVEATRYLGVSREGKLRIFQSELNRLRRPRLIKPLVRRTR